MYCRLGNVHLPLDKVISQKLKEETMAWMKEDGGGESKGPKKQTWNYKPGVDFLTVLDKQTKHLVVLAGDKDPTGTWDGPLGVWIHQYKKGAGSFVTHFSDKFNVACPLAFENDLFKARMPDYKARNMRLPFPLSKKGIIQVYDFEMKKVLWFLAGKEIDDGMDFILTNQAAAYKGVISIYRSGSGLNTKYRVDISQKELTEEDKVVIASQIKPASYVDEYIRPFNEQEFLARTGINATAYFQQHEKDFGLVDMSQYGAIPGGLAGVQVGQDFKGNAVVAPNTAVSAATGAVASSPTTTTPTTPMVMHGASGATSGGDWQKALERPIESSPAFKGKTLRDVFKTSGEAYLKYLVNTGSVEAPEALAILNNIEHVKAFIAASAA